MKITKLPSGDVFLCKENVSGDLSSTVEKLIEESEKLEKFGILSPIIFDSKGKIFWHGGYVQNFNIIPMSYAAGQEYTGQYPGTREVEVVPFYFCIISKALVEKLGLPDNPGVDIFEDANYCLQALANEFSVCATDVTNVKYDGLIVEQDKMNEKRREFVEGAKLFKKRWESTIKERFGLPVCYHTSLSAPTGFSMAARGYVKALQRCGIDVHYSYLRDVPEMEKLADDEEINSVIENLGDMEMPQVIWAQAPYFFKNSGKYKIGHCEFEGEEWPESWIKYCNMMDEVWVPTKWDREKAVKGGVNVPIYVIYQGIDPDYFHPKMLPMQIDVPQKFKFVVNAAWLHRKNLPALIKTFCGEFKKSEDVCLIVKTLNVGLVKSISEEIKKIKVGNDTGWVYVREENWPGERLGCLYTATDCLVLPTHGEGWGLPIFESLACGTPVITTGYGAPIEVLRDDDKKPLPGVHFLDYNLADLTFG